MWLTRFELCAIACCCIIGSACDRGPPQGKVFGKVTSAGQPLSAGMVVFSNAERGVHINAPVQPDGSYQLHTARGIGLPLGAYQVAVNSPMSQPAMPGAPAPPPRPRVNIPSKYTRPATSGLTLTVVEGENPFDIAME
jgi:hypothetical protein